MREENIILKKTHVFAVRIIKLYMFLRKNKVDIGLCSQLLRSGTAIGANAEEAVGGASRMDFINKLQIAYKEVRETKYWLNLLTDGEVLEARLSASLIKDCAEISKILTAILITSKTVRAV